MSLDSHFAIFHSVQLSVCLFHKIVMLPFSNKLSLVCVCAIRSSFYHPLSNGMEKEEVGGVSAVFALSSSRLECEEKSCHKCEENTADDNAKSTTYVQSFFCLSSLLTVASCIYAIFVAKSTSVPGAGGLSQFRDGLS